jgi:hypothetical protein
MPVKTQPKAAVSTPGISRVTGIQQHRRCECFKKVRSDSDLALSIRATHETSTCAAQEATATY